MGILSGIVPKYLAVYSICKAFFLIKEIIATKYQRALLLTYIIKIFLCLIRIVGLKSVYSGTAIYLNIVSVVSEGVFAFSRSSSKLSTVFQLALTFFTLILILFFHPFYYKKAQKKTK